MKVLEGFEVSLYADDDLCHDVFSMTVDAFGRIVVSGPGYVRILHDRDGDGKAEAATQFANGPASGSQGMYFYGRDLICTGDNGLWRYRDRNGDDRADGPPELFLKIAAGGEHDAHAIRKGPDGWWYLLSGNMAGVSSSYVTLPTSPVKQPRAGTLLRFRPDMSGGEVFSDGYRNAYDFDFGPTGEVFVFDSDGEREVSLPWYLPARMFASLPGTHHGWVTESWKHPDYFPEMPPTVAEFGRSSPTGVVAYHHSQFPAEYRGALFGLDWTYGRVWAMPLEQNGSTWKSTPIEFMSAVGQHGFAPTDCEVGPDGSLYVCVGGRGTRGGVYRIRAAGSQAKAWAPALATPADKLNACLQAPQPLSSWSRLVWEPLTRELRAEAFIAAARDVKRPESERIRAIEILTEKFQGLNAVAEEALAQDSSARLRERTAWSSGRVRPATPNVPFMARVLGDSDPLVVRSALEAITAASPAVFDELVAPIGAQLGHSDKYVRQAAIRVVYQTGRDAFRSLSAVAINSGWQGAASIAAGFSLKKPGYTAYPIDIGVRILKAKHPVALKIEATRLIQSGLGDLAPTDESLDAAFDGYRSRVDLSPHDTELQTLADTLLQVYPSANPVLDQELERIIAMLELANPALLESVLAAINSESHPTTDVHRLLVAARIPAERTDQQRTAIAHALIELEVKVKQLGLVQDTDWTDRMLGLYSLLVQRDAQLPAALLAEANFGLPGHVIYVSELPPEKLEEAIAAFVRQIETDPDYAWNADVVFLIGASSDQKNQQLIRSKMDDFALRNAVLMTIAEKPSEQDRPLYVQGLQTAPTEVMVECLRALALLNPSNDPVENVVLLQNLRRMTPRDQELEVRDQSMELLRRNLGETFGYVLARPGEPQTQSIQRWTAFIQQKYPEEFARQTGAVADDQAALDQLLTGVDWTKGDARRGQKLFQTRGCIQCHSSRQALGPDLAGVAGRFSRQDLFTAIMFPHRDVSPRYQTTQVATRDGQIRSGLIVYESVDGVVLRDATNQTYRMDAKDIEERRTTDQSLMPSGLLKDLKPGDIADLYAFLGQLGSRTSTVPRTADRSRSE